MAVPVINLCIDCASPYSWLCSEVVLRYKERWGVRLLLRPVLLGAVMKATGNSMPSLVPARGKWSLKDMAVNARFMQVPFMGAPSTFGTPKFNTILCQRVLTAIALEKGYESEDLVNAFRSLWRAIYGIKHLQDLDLADSAFTFQCCLDAGISEEEAMYYLRKANDNDVKNCLKENTDLAVKKGAFGVPSMFVYMAGDENMETQWQRKVPDYFIFGSDRFEQLAFLLKKPWNGPVPLSRL